MLFRLEAGSPRAGKEGHHISNARSFTALLRLGLTCLDFTKMLKREKGFQNEIKGCFPKTNVIRRKSNKSRWAGKFHYDRDQTGSKPTESIFFLLSTTHSEYCAIVVCGSTAVGYLAGRCNRSRACIDEVGPGAGAGALRNAHRAR